MCTYEPEEAAIPGGLVSAVESEPLPRALDPLVRELGVHAAADDDDWSSV